MPRNLDNRLEIVVPVEDSRARQKISAMFDALLADNAQAWELRARQHLETTAPEEGRSPARRAGRPHAKRGCAGPSPDCGAPWVAVAVPTYAPLRMGS